MSGVENQKEPNFIEILDNDDIKSWSKEKWQEAMFIARKYKGGGISLIDKDMAKIRLKYATKTNIYGGIKKVIHKALKIDHNNNR